MMQHDVKNIYGHCLPFKESKKKVNSFINAKSFLKLYHSITRIYYTVKSKKIIFCININVNNECKPL